MGFEKHFRRWTGFILIAGSLAMLVLGITVFQNRLTGSDYIIYWLSCFALTGLAAMVALMDFFSIKREARDEQRDLLQRTLHEIEEESEELKDKED